MSETNKKLKNNDIDKSDTEVNNQLTMSMSEAIDLFHNSINTGPEYVCTCCDQLWYRSSVTKCNPTMYKLCSKKYLIYALLGKKVLITLNGYALHATQT